ncbi:MAG: MlaD family protein [Pseudomonadota bacterium]
MTQIESAPVEPPKASPRVSAVWLVPLLAIVIALGVAWQNYSSRGPLIQVEFETAAGVRAGETELRYRDIAVGLVEGVRFANGLSKVTLDIRLSQDIAPFVDTDARFWVVQPEVTTQGVSGLETVLSGVYLEGDWDGTVGAAQTTFVGSARAPLLSGGREGTLLTLTSATEVPPTATPILYRGVPVGQIGEATLAEGGQTVQAEAVIYAPHDRLVTSATRFWDISGFSFTLGAGGPSLDFSSLSSLISGGVTFETLASGGAALPDAPVFALYEDEETARQQYLLEGETGAVQVQVIFDQNLPGLAAGAAVNLGGVRIGEVLTIGGLTDPARFGDGQVRLLATLRLVPGRIGFASEDEEAFLDFLADRVDQGLRAQLATASLLTGGLRVELVEIPEAEEAVLDRTADPFPLLPTAPANVTDVSASAQGLLQRVEALPVEAVIARVIALLDATTALVASEDLQAAPAELTAALASLRRLVESDDIAGLPAQLGAVTAGIVTATEQVNAILAEIQAQAILMELSETLQSFGRAAEGVPALSQEAMAVLGQVQTLALADLVAQSSALVGTAEEWISGQGVQALPGEASAALDALRATLGTAQGLLAREDLAALPGEVSTLIGSLQDTATRLGGLVAEVEASALVARVAQTVEDVGAAAGTLPGLAEQAANVLSDAEALSLETLTARATDLMVTANALLADDAVRAVPVELNTALTALSETLEDLRAGGLVDNANLTLASAREAAEALAQASESLPALAARLNTLAGEAGAALGDYGRDGPLGRELATALREIETAAASVDRLARQIARNPNSLLTGR